MTYQYRYHSPLGDIIVTSDGNSITGLWIKGEKYCKEDFKNVENSELAIFKQTKEWLDVYFSGKNPGPIPPISFCGTPFRHEIWNMLLDIPYGQVITYGDIAKKVANKHKISSMSAQAVGGAVGHNPIGILVPCHRVVGRGDKLTGFAAGIDKKIKLLKLEKIDVEKYNE